jgi:general stress protein 26
MTEAQQVHVDRVWEVVDRARICMMTTHFAEGLRARPMEAMPSREEDVIWFLTDIRGLKDDEIEASPEVCLTFVCPEDRVYLSIAGTASARRDPAQAQALWSKKQEAWWNGPDDPNLLVLQVEPRRGEIWDGPASSAVAAFEFAKARVTGEKPDLGENRKATVDMR